MGTQKSGAYLRPDANQKKYGIQNCSVEQRTNLPKQSVQCILNLIKNGNCLSQVKREAPGEVPN